MTDRPQPSTQQTTTHDAPLDWSTPPKKRRALKVLIADDNELSCRLAAKLLHMRGHEATSVFNGREVLEELTRKQYDVVLMDVDMPELDGLETTRVIRAVEEDEEEPYPLPIIAMTAYTDQESIRLCFEAGMNARVNKPVELADLYSVVEDTVLSADTSGQTSTIDVSGSEHHRRVLVADDNPVNQQLLLRMLTRCGFDVEIAGDGRAAVDAVRDRNFDFCLMDLQMPVMGGIEATRLIREVYDAEEFPIVAVTGNYRKHKWEECQAAGMTHRIKKPIDLESLLALLRELCQTIPLPETEQTAFCEAETDDDGWVDVETVMERVCHDHEFLVDLVELFDQTAANLSDELTIALREDDADKAYRTLHALKAPVASFTSARPLRLIKRMEREVEADNLDATSRLMPTLRDVLGRLRTELHNLIGSTVTV